MKTVRAIPLTGEEYNLLENTFEKKTERHKGMLLMTLLAVKLLENQNQQNLKCGANPDEI